MLSKLILIAFAVTQASQDPQAVIACASAVQEHNQAIEEVSSVLEDYAACLRSGQLSACSAEFSRVEAAQARFAATAAEVRSRCPEEQIELRG